MAITKFESFNFNNLTPSTTGWSATGHFSWKSDQAKCVEGKNTVWLFAGEAAATYKKAAKKLGTVVVVENVSQAFIDDTHNTITEYNDVAPKLGFQCKLRMVFERNGRKLKASFATVDY